MVMVGSMLVNRVEKRLPCQFGIAVDARDKRGPGHRGIRRHVDDGLLGGCDPESCDVPDDADHRERSRLEAAAGRRHARVSDMGSGSRRTTWPSASAFGHSASAVASETMATERLDERSSGVNARPRTTAISSTLKYSGETNLYATVAFAPAPSSANAARGAGDRRPATMRPRRQPTVRPSPPARSHCGSARSRFRR